MHGIKSKSLELYNYIVYYFILKWFGLLGIYFFFVYHVYFFLYIYNFLALSVFKYLKLSFHASLQKFLNSFRDISKPATSLYKCSTSFKVCLKIITTVETLLKLRLELSKYEHQKTSNLYLSSKLRKKSF